MNIQRLHDWEVSTKEAVELQQKLAGRISRSGTLKTPRLIAGMDISAEKSRGVATVAVVVLSYPGLELVEVKVIKGETTFPYVPGLLSFREAPLILEACKKLDNTPDLFLVDGQGIADPRRMGIASHLGLFLDKPTIGCAKSRLCGEHDEPGMKAGTYAEVTDDGEVIGVVLRTRDCVKPVYVSIGHKISLPSAINWTLKCCRGFRIPEPTRLAHLAAGGNLPLEKAAVKI